MTAKRPTIVVAVEARPDVREKRIELLNFLSATIPNAYPSSTERPKFIFAHFDPEDENGAGTVPEIAFHCSRYAQIVLEKQQADLCLYAAIGGARDTGHRQQERAAGVIAIVEPAGVLRIDLAGPFFAELDPETEARIEREVQDAVGNMPTSPLMVHAAELGTLAIWMVDAMLDNISTRH